ncbi:MAG: signal peptide peptidase SppA [Halothiobacillaceae bacterium]|jgi:protease-4
MNDTSSKTPSGALDDPTWQRALIARLAEASLTEQRRARRWGIFFKLLGFGYLLFILVMMYREGPAEDRLATQPHTALVTLEGPIMEGSPGGAETIIKGLRKAFENKHAQGVVLRINSPGGSPVQSGYIYDEIRRLRAKYPDKPLYAVIADIGASGGYYVAAAADAIYADKASIVGSIGVRMDGFGVVEAMKKLGIEHRELTAGEHKALMSPFKPVDPAEKAHMERLLGEVHAQFMDVVRKGRGERLKETPELFSGLVWTGEQAVGLGLVDGLGGVDYVAREIVKAEKVVDVTPKGDVFERLIDRLGVSISLALMRAQFGLWG